MAICLRTLSGLNVAKLWKRETNRLTSRANAESAQGARRRREADRDWVDKRNAGVADLGKRLRRRQTTHSSTSENSRVPRLFVRLLGPSLRCLLKLFFCADQVPQA